MGLVLAATEQDGPWRWRWLLHDGATGQPLADHWVQLDPASAEVARFADLYGYARWHASPDRQTADETRVVSEAGAWAARVLLGEEIAAAIAAAAPVTVRVTAPPGLPVLSWPLELAHVDGEPLAARGDIALVYDVAPAPAHREKATVTGALRMLAVFSQPTANSVLALRRERHALTRLIRTLGARAGRRVELQVVQYGATRKKLADIADLRDGWDVLHLSGHGGQGLFLLEKADGSPDPVEVADLVKLLRPMRRRVKLAVVSACQSAADTTAETLRLVGLAEQAGQLQAETATGNGGPAAGSLARTLVAELDCPVVGMRYPVSDDFAIAFADVFYEHLLAREQPADVAVARAVATAASPEQGWPSAARPAVSLATPGVFGAQAADLAIPVPPGDPEINPARIAMAFFPPEPERFVGRAAAMAAASAALAPGSGHTTVLLHGMAGAGKTACALELAYRHQDAFSAVAFWQAPTKDDEFGTALPSLAIALETQLGAYGFTMTGHIATLPALEGFLPRLRQLLRDRGLLLVLDNLETLLTPEGTWRDPRWAPLLAALTGHGGESRLILTSRIPPAGLTGTQVLTRPVHALSLAEAVALARELPHLRDLLHADAGPVRAQAEAEVSQDRDRVRRVLHVVQGHPKLLELANAAAADRDRLDRQLAAAETAAAGTSLEAFFHDGVSTLDPDQFLTALAAWTSAALKVLPPATRLLVELVACLEDDDRQPGIIEANWADLWQHLDQPGDPPGVGPLLDALADAALIQPETAPASAADDDMPADGVQDGAAEALPQGQAPPVAIYRMHPGVATTIAATAEPGVREAADAELAAFWVTVAGQAWGRDGGEDTGLVVHASLAATPYLLRRRDWRTVSSLLEHAIGRDGSPRVTAAALPPLRRIAAATGSPADDAVLASALLTVDPTEAGQLARGALARAAAAGDDGLASAIAGDLMNLLLDAGRLAEALELAGQKAGYTRRAGLGPWTQLSDQARRLQILALMGEHEQVLAETETLRGQMSQLPDRPGDTDPVPPWNVREGILNTGYSSALALRWWPLCLELNAEIVASTRQRGAGEYELARTRFSDAAPLINMGRVEDAGRLLRWCQQVFEDHRDTAGLATVLSVRAGLEDELGHRQAAGDFARAALRLGYARPVPHSLAINHNNLAIYLGAAVEDRTEQRAHWLAAALIRRLADMAYDLARTLRVLAGELREDAAAEGPPVTVAEVVTVAERTEGVRLGELLAALEPDPQAVEAALAEILRAAADLPPDDEPDGADIAGHLEQWEPVIAVIVAACQGDQAAVAELRPFLDKTAQDPDWATLAAVLLRILAGERGDGLLDGLDPVDTAIATETLRRFTPGDQDPEARRQPGTTLS